MRILFISKEGDGLGVAQRVAFEGHSVDVWVANDRYARSLRGIVNRVANWRSAALGADLIICDTVGMGRLEEGVRATGRPCMGFCRQLDAIELDRRLGMELFERVGVATPETFGFESAREAERLPGEHGWQDGWVLKANGNTKATAVVRDESAWPRAVSLLPANASGIVQRVVSGVEVSTEGWFNGSTFITPFNHTFEEKKFLAGGLGATTGCEGNVVLRADSNRLTQATVERTAPFLKLLGYRGPFDVNAIVNESGAYALEVTSRMGYDAVEALAEGLNEPLGDFLFDVAMGTRRSMDVTADTMIAVRMSVPPYPVRAPDRNAPGEPISGLDEAALRHVFLLNVEKKGDQYLTADGDGIVLKATAVGASRAPRIASHAHDYTYEARRRVYRLLDRINVRDKQYRTDIGGRVNDDIAKLKTWGWLDG